MEKLNLQNKESEYIKGHIVHTYIHLVKNKLLFGILLIICIVFVFVYSITSGSLQIPLSNVFSSLVSENEFSYIVNNIRLPRSVAAVIAGAALGVAGCVMQNILKNPLASPFTLGVSHGAAFGAAVAIIVFNAGTSHSIGNESVTIFNVYAVIIAAFVGAACAVIIILFLSFLKNISPDAIVLAGVAMGSIFSAATMFLQYFAADFQVAATVFWTFGDLGKAGWVENVLLAGGFIPVIIYFYSQRWNYNALLWNDDVAISLGVNIQSLRLTGMLLSAFIVSLCTAFLGIIGFIGLIAPHIVRMLIGNDYRFLIPYSALFGALLLLASDCIAKLILEPVIVPVGIVTSLLGAPLFFYLLIARRTP